MLVGFMLVREFLSFDPLEVFDWRVECGHGLSLALESSRAMDGEWMGGGGS